MNKSANLVTSSPVRKLACAFGLMTAFAPTGSTAPPTANADQEVVHVEMWHGLRRVDQEKSKTPETNQPTPPAANLQPEKSESGSEPARPGGWPSGIGQGLPFAQLPPPALAGTVEPPPLAKPAPWLQELPASLTASPNPPEMKGTRADTKQTGKETKTQRSTDASEAQEAAVPPVRPVTSGTRSWEQPQDSADTLNKTVIQVAFIVAVAIVAPLVSIVSFFWLLRRHSRHFGPLFRIDYVGNGPVVTGPFSASTAGLVGQEDLMPALDRGGRFDLQAEAPVEATRVEEVAEAFDLGPTFEDERLQKEQQAQKQEEAVLQHLFEDNLRLHEQIELAGESENNATEEAAD